MNPFRIIAASLLIYTMAFCHEDVHITFDEQEYHDGITLSFDGPGLRPTLKIKEDIKIFIKHNDLIICHQDSDDEVAISDEGELYINDKRIDTNRKQEKLLLEYHDLGVATFDKAEEIAKEAMKVGLKGAELGLKAVTGVFRMLLPEYSSEDFERDMEKEGEKIETKAQVLEDKAEIMEKLVEEMQELHEQVGDSVPELDELSWF
ncbi:MAG: hypothetical protein EHM72_11040 [Calditrichaeota bacterium]|nr:MAG: hypothetical protein EHM72_11040 [Calditrichota bacterium]